MHALPWFSRYALPPCASNFSVGHNTRCYDNPHRRFAVSGHVFRCRPFPFDYFATESATLYLTIRLPPRLPLYGAVRFCRHTKENKEK
jgi:hypothetical protein